jgi:hypothetical protein
MRASLGAPIAAMEAKSAALPLSAVSTAVKEIMEKLCVAG